MSFFENSSNVTINGGNFSSTRRKKGIDLLLEHVAPGAFHNSRERYDHPKCHPNTRVAVIQAIIDWIEDGQKVSFIRWLSGPAGAGKSAIAQEIAELCHKKGYLAASFFWSRSSAGRNNEECLITSLAYQLLIAIPEIRGYVDEAVETDPAFFTRSLESQMQFLVIEPLRKVFGSDQRGRLDFYGPKVIILDGLDECGTPDAQRYILRVISHSVRKLPIPLVFLIASRPEQAIRDSFDNQPLLEITSRLVLDEKYKPDDDIRLLLVESFQSVKTTHKLRSLLRRDWPTHKDISNLVQKSSGQFIYASTVVKFVASPRRKPHDQLKIILGITASVADAPFAELDALYRHIFKAVEDLPRVLEVLSSLFLINEYRLYEGSIASHIQRILCYDSGDLQLVLTDLHSLLQVPDVTDESDDLRVLHASLHDFLMDSDRAGDLYIDKGQAYARLTRRYLRYIKFFYENKGNRWIEDTKWELRILSDLRHFYSYASSTPDLFADFFAFDFLAWETILIENTKAYGHGYNTPYLEFVNLYIWLKDQETILPNQFGPERCLSIDLCPLFGRALDLVCKYWCQCFCEERSNPDSARNLMALITHPEFNYHLKGHDLDAVYIVTGCYVDEVQEYYEQNDNKLDPLRGYLLDPERAGDYFVTDATHARLSVRIFTTILSGLERGRVKEGICANDKTQQNSEEDVDDEALWHSCVFDLSRFRLNENVLKFSIKILPFFLSKANYRPKLDKFARMLLARTLLARTLLSRQTAGYTEYIMLMILDELQPEMELLHDAINLYLNKRPLSLNPPQEQRHGSTMENQVPKESIDTCIPVSDQRVESQKRQRNTSFKLATPPSSPSTSRPFKRLKIVDMPKASGS